MLPFGKPEGLIIFSLNELSLFCVQNYKLFLNLASKNQDFFKLSTFFRSSSPLEIPWKTKKRHLYTHPTMLSSVS